MMRAAFIALCALASACVSAPTPREAAATDARTIRFGESYTIQSQVLGAPREINVWTPTGYADSSDRYTALFVLDGGVDQDFPHIAGLGQLAALSGAFGPFIVVGVKTEQRRAELTRRPNDPRHAAEFPDAGGAPQFQEFLAREVIPFVEARYRTGERRALMGESLAGLFVIDTFLHRPDLFGDYVAVSPSLWWDDQHFARHGGHDLEGRAQSDQRLYLTIANEGGAMQAGMDRFVRLLQSAPSGSVTWRYVDRSASETHATIYHGAALDALRWLYAAPPYDYGPPAWYFEDSGAASQHE